MRLVRRNVPQGHDGTHGKIGTVTAVQIVIFRHQFGANPMGYGERLRLFRRVEVSSVLDLVSLNITTRQ